MFRRTLLSSCASMVALSFLASFACPSSSDAQIIYQNNFDQYTYNKRYRESDLDNDWNSPEWSKGVKEGRVKIEKGYQAFGNSGSCLAVKSPRGTYGTSRSGASWKMFLDDSYEEVYLTYNVKFKRGFDFVRGGKLPGLAGGTAPTGSTTATGYNGWTGRFMWRTFHLGNPGSPKQKTSQMISYTKYFGSGLDNDGKDEEETFLADGDDDLITIESNKWYEITQRIKMNDHWTSNGIQQVWLNGELVVDQSNIRYRKTADLGIDQLYFSTFFGGGYSWRTSKYETMYFDNFSIFAVE